MNLPLSKKEQVECVIILIVLILGLANFTGKFKKRLRRVKQKIENIKSKEGKLEEVTELYRIVKNKIKQFKLKRDLRSIVYSSAKECRVDIQAIVPKKESKYLGLDLQSIQLEVKASFNDLLCFLSRVEDTKDAFVVLEDLKILRKEGIRWSRVRYYADIKIRVFSSDDKN